MFIGLFSEHARFRSCAHTRAYTHPAHGSRRLRHSCTLTLRGHSPASRLRGKAVPPRLRAMRATRTPTPITYADCPNQCLYQFGSRSVQPFGHQRWICSLSVYARLCTHTHARERWRTRAHTHTHIQTRTRTHTHTVLSRYSPKSARCKRAN
jgi:hypothetical protein